MSFRFYWDESTQGHHDPVCGWMYPPFVGGWGDWDGFSSAFGFSENIYGKGRLNISGCIILVSLPAWKFMLSFNPQAGCRLLAVGWVWNRSFAGASTWIRECGFLVFDLDFVLWIFGLITFLVLASMNCRFGQLCFDWWSCASARGSGCDGHHKRRLERMGFPRWDSLSRC